MKSCLPSDTLTFARTHEAAACPPNPMKDGIHPSYHSITITCACGNSFTTGSTLKDNLRVEICSHCHPLYSGKAKLIDTAGRVDKFQARQAKAAAAQAEAEKRQAARTKN